MNNNHEAQRKVCFVNSEEPPLKVKHICYFTTRDGDGFVLWELVEEYFPHPDAPDEAILPCYNIYSRDKRNLTENACGPLIQSWAMENTLKLLYPVTSARQMGILNF